MVVLGLIIFKAKALFNPKRIRLSTYKKQSFNQLKKTLSIFKDFIIHQSAIDEPVHREVQGTRMDSIHGASGFGERSVGSS